MPISDRAFATIISPGEANVNAKSSSDSLNIVGTGGTSIITDPSTNTVTINSNGTGGATAWGTITGTLSSQTDLQTALDGKTDENFSGYPEKTTLVDDDLFVINDSENAGAIKKVKKSNLGISGGLSPYDIELTGGNVGQTDFDYKMILVTGDITLTENIAVADSVQIDFKDCGINFNGFSFVNASKTVRFNGIAGDLISCAINIEPTASSIVPPFTGSGNNYFEISNMSIVNNATVANNNSGNDAAVMRLTNTLCIAGTADNCGINLNNALSFAQNSTISDSSVSSTRTFTCESGRMDNCQLLNSNVISGVFGEVGALGVMSNTTVVGTGIVQINSEGTIRGLSSQQLTTLNAQANDAIFEGCALSSGNIFDSGYSGVSMANIYEAGNATLSGNGTNANNLKCGNLTVTGTDVSLVGCDASSSYSDLGTNTQVTGCNTVIAPSGEIIGDYSGPGTFNISATVKYKVVNNNEIHYIFPSYLDTAVNNVPLSFTGTVPAPATTQYRLITVQSGGLRTLDGMIEITNAGVVTIYPNSTASGFSPFGTFGVDGNQLIVCALT